MVATSKGKVDAEKVELVSALVEARTLVHHAEQLLVPAVVLLERFEKEMTSLQAWDKTPPVEVDEARATFTSTRDAADALRENAYALKQFMRKVQGS